ncbi:hypothetical protein GRJ2_002530500 [Grus japonensis]|uniref:Uncharacterized protein n=1 Tax=Grus japonensis TaxID=30415 RepID=A0ABC9XSE8_GRUJA
MGKTLASGDSPVTLVWEQQMSSAILVCPVDTRRMRGRETSQAEDPPACLLPLYWLQEARAEDAAQTQTLGRGQQVEAPHQWEASASLQRLVSSDCRHGLRRRQPEMSNVEVMAVLACGLSPVPGAPGETRKHHLM